MKPWEEYQKPIAEPKPWEEYAAQPVQTEAQPEMGKLETLSKGFVRGLRDIPDAGAQLLRRAVPENVGTSIDQFGNYLSDVGLPIARSEGVEGVDAIVRAAEEDYQKNWRGGRPAGLDVGRIGGNIAATAPLVSLVPGAMAASLPARMTAGAATGAGVGLLSPVQNTEDFASEKTKQVGMGALFGGIAPAIIEGGARVIKPQISKAVQALMGEGVTPTPGQILGGAAKRIEEGLTSVPIIGDAIQTAQRRAVNDVNRAALNRVLEPLGQKLGKKDEIGYEAIRKVGGIVSDAYDDLLPKLKVHADKKFTTEINDLAKVASNLPSEQARQFESILQNEVLGKFTGFGKMMGETMKGVDSKIGGLIRSYRGSQNPDHRLLADALGEVQFSLRSLVERANPSYAGQLSKINQAYANLLRVENAASRLGSKEGVFSPAAISGASRAMDKTLRKRASARGQALMQDLGENAQNVIGQSVPDSGTPFRTINALALGGGAVVNPWIPAGAVAGAAMYSSPAQKMLAALLTKRPQLAGPLADQLRRLSVPASMALPAAYNSGE